MTFQLDRRDEAGNPIDLQAGFGFAPFLDSASRALAFGSSPALSASHPHSIAPSFSVAGLIGQVPLSIYSVSPFIMLVDTGRLGDLPTPRAWRDLLDPIYRGQVAISAEEPASNIALLYCYRRYGEDGVRALVKNVACSASASVMAMLPAHPQPACGSIFIIPWFFARCCSHLGNVAVIWPDEGALCFPLWLALRTGASEAARDVAAYFNGDAFARESAGSCLPTANARSDDMLGTDAKRLLWVGWDFLESLEPDPYIQFIEAIAAGIRRVDAS